jgi:hypothetical protein
MAWGNVYVERGLVRRVRDKSHEVEEMLTDPSIEHG